MAPFISSVQTDTLHQSEQFTMTASSTEKSLTSTTCVLQKPGYFTCETREVSQRCVGRQVLVKVAATGICGSDVSSQGTTQPQELS